MVEDCAAIGRRHTSAKPLWSSAVVQMSGAGPDGIPSNSRYILLMNNHIQGIQLDLLKHLSSLEFLLLTNNRLTDGAIAGAFDGAPALKRLFLDGNLLASIPAGLPVWRSCVWRVTS
ncbi:leucine-rich repeat-containing protein 4-like isoform X2 [Synchiropus splendidus]|uniref:leucine-rich repeat-containing protein 4-like isoform X2 n=1 Tax=Synchiropus splendidus TaxID=270530 RepID=UPI00237E07CC|nr:leucine-rich repeat-containing protein 4-like isoform X2 [Synchiropus splendidus]